ncbi:PREDICTED: uncharacterized protein LOC106819532 [Priapulus caudatus]|uniref:Uncharacterized protein LOC106819532 n=1 Tax=Priapulus caudatus TaxID=37621 RepID=A0ABM1F5B5_PRICU|nr:PREDICTED: uncharacterized protein LOC106819532 [Priapulus caudatus]
MPKSKASTKAVSGSGGAHWKDEEVLTLINVWGEEEIFRETEDTRMKKKTVYIEISRRLEAIGILRDVSQIKSKIKNLKWEFKLILKQNNKSGNDGKTMKFYNELNSFLGHRPANNPPSGSVLETATVSSPDTPGTSTSDTSDMESEVSINTSREIEEEVEEAPQRQGEAEDNQPPAPKRKKASPRDSSVKNLIEKMMRSNHQRDRTAVRADAERRRSEEEAPTRDGSVSRANVSGEGAVGIRQRVSTKSKCA